MDKSGAPAYAAHLSRPECVAMTSSPRTPAARRVLRTAARYFDRIAQDLGELLVYQSQDPILVRVYQEHGRERADRPRD
jgi:hypothetical protein